MVFVIISIFSIIFGGFALAMSAPGMNSNAGEEVISDDEKAWNEEQHKEQREYLERLKSGEPVVGDWEGRDMH